MAEKLKQLKLINDLLPKFSQENQSKLSQNLKPQVSSRPKIDRPKLNSKLSSLNLSHTDILNLLTLLKEFSSEEPKIFPTIFPAYNKDYFFQLLVTIYLNNLSDNNEISTTIKNKIISLLITLLNYYDCKREISELIYEYLSTYLGQKNKTPQLNFRFI